LFAAVAAELSAACAQALTSARLDAIRTSQIRERFMVRTANGRGRQVARF
jgi:hypothetical protein